MSGYTIKRLDEVDDVLGDYPGEMRMMTATSNRAGRAHLPADAAAHRRQGLLRAPAPEQEELYFVISGRLQFKLGDDVIEVGRRHGDPGRRPTVARRSGTTSPRTGTC